MLLGIEIKALNLIAAITILYFKRKIGMRGILHVVIFVVHIDTNSEGSSQSSLSPVPSGGNHLITAGAPRRSKRIAGKKVCRYFIQDILFSSDKYLVYT